MNKTTLADHALPFTGERFVPERQDEIAIEHMHRYALAMEFCDNKDILDIASGEGYGSDLLATRAKSVIGVDIAKEAIEHSQSKYQRSNLRYLEGRADSIPLDACSVDVVVSFETLEHHNMHEEMYAEIKRVLRPGGLLIISTPDKLFYSDLPKFENEYHVKELYLEEFRNLSAKYFKNVTMVFQKLAYGSLLVSEQNNTAFEYYAGTVGEIDSSAQLPEPTYNICMASDETVPPVGVSLFDAAKILADYQAQSSEKPRLDARLESLSKQLNDVVNSRSYRLGRMLTWLPRKISGGNT
ncbi:methyltransferase [Sulfuriferula multivorans]|uniref:Methyltransferase n=1 Tax=Sulfuriferula multivorans TaxID=1559896 RepID=A0A401JDX4_9PROT|nr:class I SAM-dependent methyltransferase [Sulfuriferula multivorans]GBL45767.1 methyltransferase [Sulfuriferula multivorans]